MAAGAPYPGPMPFKTEEANLFFGREREARDLMALLSTNPVILLYAQSGSGKSSLINARLIPMLHKKNLAVLPVARVSGALPDQISQEQISNIFVFNAVLSCAGIGSNAQSLLTASLGDVFNSPEMAGTNLDGAVRILIFDQFEEIFTRHVERWQDRRGLFEQLATLVEKDPQARVLLAIREDHLAQLDPFSDLLPGRLRARYRIEPLREEQALLAITGPLASTQRRYGSGVAENLVKELLQLRVEAEDGTITQVRGEFVEPVQLQVVCKGLWDRLPADATVISDKHRQTYANVDRALSDFYEMAISATAKQTSIHPYILRRWCGTQLITSTGTRGLVHRGPSDTAGLANKGVESLEELHLIHGEYRAGARWYELTHDRMIAPIQDSNKKWEEQRYHRMEEAFSMWQHAEMLERKGKIEKAIDLMTKYYEFVQELYLPEEAYSALFFLGRAYTQLENFDRAHEAHWVAFRLAMDHGKTAEARQTLTAISELLRLQGRSEQALELLAALIKDNPEDWIPYATRGDIYLTEKRYRKAIQNYKRAIQLFPYDASLYESMGFSYYCLRNDNQAEKCLRRAIALDDQRASGPILTHESL